MTWQFSTSDGALYHDGARIGRGYSGQPPHVNKPEDEGLKDKGPIPRGYWTIIGRPYNSAMLGPFVMVLEPKPGTETFGRSAFRIHGDSKSRPGYASHGCIVLDRTYREAIWHSSDPDVLVIS
jgi:hypothetical protein